MQRTVQRFALAFLLSILPPITRAESPPSPLSAIPAEADLVIEIKQPAILVESIAGLDLLKQLQSFAAAREALSGTKVRRFRQFVAYLERELGASWPRLLDQLAGGGIALGVKLGPNPAPTLLVLQGKDDTLQVKFLDLLAKLAEQEIARQDGKGKPVRGKYEGMESLRIGDGFHAVARKSALLVSNKGEVLKHTLALLQGAIKGKMSADRPEVAEARKLLPTDPLVNLWLNLDPVRQTPGAKALYKKPRDDQNLTFLVGGYLDVIGRAPWLAAGLCREKDGVSLQVRLPAGRDGMGPDRAFFVPPDHQPGSRPLLAPKGVLYSDSSFQDYSRIWIDRKNLFNEKQVAALEKFDEGSGRFLSGMRLSTLLGQAGAYHRVVVVNQPTVPYQKKPKQPLPAFAFVLELREPEKFGKSIDTILRGAALLALTQAKLKITEEQVGDCAIVGWRFDESAPLRQDTNDIRFNFSPCFTRVGNQFVFCSTLKLCRELIDLIRKEQVAQSAQQTARTRLYAAGAADALAAAEDTLLAQTILDQALAPAEARAQVKQFIDFVRQLGTLDLTADFGTKEFRYDIRLSLGK